jgi:hypothetical protein
LVKEAENGGPHDDPDEAIASVNSCLKIACYVSRVEVSDTHKEARTYVAQKLLETKLKGRYFVIDIALL